jgi:uridine phosphorylase
MSLESSELVLNPDGSLYHIALRPEHIHDHVIVVGDPGRVDLIASFFDSVDHSVQNREYYTKVGSYHGMTLTVMSTGIGTDNIDIALNELDAAINVDLVTRQIKEEKRSINIIRLGTCGALQEDVPVDTMVASKYGLGFDGLMNFYDFEYSDAEISLRDAFIYDTGYPVPLAKPYIIEGDQDLRLKVAPGKLAGITATASGFYAPQGRVLRIPTKYGDMNERLRNFEYKEERIINFEMETSALYGLSRGLGHKACTVCAVIANRQRKEYSKDYKSTVKTMIGEVLERLTSN